MIVAVVNTPVKELEEILRDLDVNFKRYKKHIRFNGHLIFPSVFVYKKALKQDIIKNTPIVIDSVSHIYELALTNKVCYIDARLKMNGIVHFEKINSEKLLAYLDAPLEDNQTEFSFSKLESILNKLLLGFPTVIHRPFITAFIQGIKDKWKIFSTFIKDNRLITYDNKKYYIQLDTLINKIFVQKERDDETEKCIDFLRNCYNIYESKDLGRSLDKENNIKV